MGVQNRAADRWVGRSGPRMRFAHRNGQMEGIDDGRTRYRTRSGWTCRWNDMHCHGCALGPKSRTDQAEPKLHQPNMLRVA